MALRTTINRKAQTKPIKQEKKPPGLFTVAKIFGNPKANENESIIKLKD